MSANEKYFFKNLLDWYDKNRRVLPWRQTKDPYIIWVSEVILQQTRVDQGLPYFLKFISTFPNVNRLADAPEEKILRIWQGLGYYSRARNMLRCAQTVVREHQGVFPVRYETLIKLPGIGPYTAAAVSSIAAGELQAVVDGNVFRVFSRIFGLEQPINSPEGKIIFNKKANDLMSLVSVEKISPGDYNQAVMEFGALQCIPKNPDCEQCPLARICFAFQSSAQHLLPVKNPKPSKRDRYFNYLILYQKGKIWMNKRLAGDVWEGLYDFLLIETRPRINSLQLKIKFESLVGQKVEIQKMKSIKHVLTHQQLNATFFVAEISERVAGRINAEGNFFTFSQAARLPKPIFIARILTELRKNRR